MKLKAFLMAFEGLSFTGKIKISRHKLETEQYGPGKW